MSSEEGNSTCDSMSECGSSCDGSSMCSLMPFTFEVTEKEPFEFCEEGLGCRIDGLTLLKGEDCVVYNEHPEFGRLCLGRLIHPHCVNVTVQMEAFTEEMKVSVESLNGKPCEVAVSGCLREDIDDLEDMPSDMEEDLGSEEEAATAASSAVTVEELPNKDDLDSQDEDEDDSEINESAESEQEDEKPAAKKAGAVAVIKTGAKKELVNKKQAVVAAATSPKAAVKAAARPEAGKAQTKTDASKTETTTDAKAESKNETKEAESKEDSSEAVKTGVKKSLGRGLSYEVLVPGKGQMAVQGKNAVVKYQLNLARTGQKIDSGSLKFRVGSGEVVQGFDKGVKGMCVNEKRRIFVPSEMGYGKKKTGNIPPNSDLVFEVTLLSTKG